MMILKVAKQTHKHEIRHTKKNYKKFSNICFVYV